MLQFIDFRYDWEHSRIIICMKNVETHRHFYVYQEIRDEAEGDEIVSFWEMHCTMFFDPVLQHPN